MMQFFKMEKEKSKVCEFCGGELKVPMWRYCGDKNCNRTRIADKSRKYYILKIKKK